jgi:hypothetical protein
LCAGHIQTPQIRCPGSGNRLLQRRIGDFPRSQPHRWSVERRLPRSFVHHCGRQAGPDAAIDRLRVGPSNAAPSGQACTAHSIQRPTGSRWSARRFATAGSNFTRLSAVCRNGQSLPSRAGNDRTGLSQTTP